MCFIFVHALQDILGVMVRVKLNAWISNMYLNVKYKLLCGSYKVGPNCNSSHSISLPPDLRAKTGICATG